MNLELVDEHLGNPQSAKAADWRFVAALLGGLMLIMLFTIFLSVVLIRWLVGAVFGG